MTHKPLPVWRDGVPEVLRAKARCWSNGVECGITVRPPWLDESDEQVAWRRFHDALKALRALEQEGGG